MSNKKCVFLRNMKLFLYLFLSFIVQTINWSSHAHAQADVYLSIRAGGSGLTPIGIEGLTPDDPLSPTLVVRQTIIEDLNKSGVFQVRVIDDRPELKPLSLFEKWR